MRKNLVNTKKVINQLREGQSLQHEKSSILDCSVSEAVLEADLTSDVWIDYTERKASRRREGFKIIMDLASQIDHLKEDLENEKRLLSEFKVERKKCDIRKLFSGEVCGNIPELHQTRRKSKTA